MSPIPKIMLFSSKSCTDRDLFQCTILAPKYFKNWSKWASVDFWFENYIILKSTVYNLQLLTEDEIVLRMAKSA